MTKSELLDKLRSREKQKVFGVDPETVTNAMIEYLHEVRGVRQKNIGNRRVETPEKISVTIIPGMRTQNVGYYGCKVPFKESKEDA